MNIVFLVEGQKTETRVYQSWLSCVFPWLTMVKRFEDITHNTFLIQSGCGRNACIETHLESFIRDTQDFGNIDHFFFCIDAEEVPYQVILNELTCKVEAIMQKHKIEKLNTELHLIIQYGCFETWALGNNEIPNQNSSGKKPSVKFLDFQNYYNILLDDPEKMPNFSSETESLSGKKYFFNRKSQFHKTYLFEYLKEFGLCRKKAEIENVLEDEKYLRALQKRCQKTDHLPSLKILFDIWESLQTNTSHCIDDFNTET
jgi:hypothetical protein